MGEPSGHTILSLTKRCYLKAYNLFSTYQKTWNMKHIENRRDLQKEIWCSKGNMMFKPGSMIVSEWLLKYYGHYWPLKWLITQILLVIYFKGNKTRKILSFHLSSSLISTLRSLTLWKNYKWSFLIITWRLWEIFLFIRTKILWSKY